jgi:hypothetical protein
MNVGVWLRSLGLDRRRLLAAIAALTDARLRRTDLHLGLSLNRLKLPKSGPSAARPRLCSAIRRLALSATCDQRSPSNALVLDIGIQPRFSSVRAKASARSSGMRPITRWLRPPRDQEASERSTRRSERIGASGA